MDNKESYREWGNMGKLAEVTKAYQLKNIDKDKIPFYIITELQTPSRYFVKCDSAQDATHQDLQTQQYYCLYESKGE